MYWFNKWNESINSGFYYELAAKGKILPEDLEPILGPFEFYVEAFFELSTCRPIGMAAGQIPFTSIVDYHRLFNVADDFTDFLYFMRKLDNAYLSKGKSGDGTTKTDSRDSNKSGHARK